ncbi:MAG: hypothetical protein NXI08_16975, partial [bacterium]|nr:hypothetical protein [bacterium]
NLQPSIFYNFQFQIRQTVKSMYNSYLIVVSGIMITCFMPCQSFAQTFGGASNVAFTEVGTDYFISLAFFILIHPLLSLTYPVFKPI